MGLFARLWAVGVHAIAAVHVKLQPAGGAAQNRAPP